MYGVIEIDICRSWSTYFERDTYIQDHCHEYRHNYSLFCQLTNINLSGHRLLFSREKPLVKPTTPGLLHIIYLQSLLFLFLFLLYLFFCFRIYIIKRAKHTLLSSICYHLFASINFFLLYPRGIDNSSTCWVARICYLCAGVVYIDLWIFLVN